MGTCFAWSNRFQVRLGAAVTATFALSALLLGGCGGSPAGAREPSATAHERASHDSNEAPSTDDDSQAEEQAPEPALCSDGTCSTCGSGLCPSGWYCDESAKGGPACGWLPQCAQKSSCSCLSRVLGSGCSCTDQSGGLHVTCK